MKRQSNNLTLADANRILEIVPDYDRLVWALLFFSHLRLGETQALLRKAVDLARRLISVTATCFASEPTPYMTKLGCWKAEIPDGLLPIFAAHELLVIERFGEQALAAEAFVIPGKELHLPFNEQAFILRSRCAFDAAGVDWCNPMFARHALRDVGGTTWLKPEGEAS